LLIDPIPMRSEDITKLGGGGRRRKRGEEEEEEEEEEEGEMVGSSRR